MKSLLLLLAAGMCAATASAQTAAEQAAGISPLAAVMAPQQVQTPKVVSAKQFGSKHIMQVVTDETGYTYKRMVTIDQANLPIKTMRSASRVRANAEGEFYRESFEDFPGTKGWQPEGWSVESKVASAKQPWEVTSPYTQLKGWDGNFAEMCDLSEKKNDEWLYSAPVPVKAGDRLQVKIWYDLLFGLDFSYIDMDTFEFTDWHPSQDLIVWIKEEGAQDWTMLKDFFDDCVGKTFDELYELYTGEFEKHIFDLSEFAGKTVVVGFQYVGKDGNGCGIDDFLIGMPQYEAQYEYPASTMFFGIAHDLTGLGTAIPVLPVYAPITWVNTTKEVEGTNPTYSWLYYNADDELVMVESKDLTTSYHTDYTSEFTTSNNLYYSPVLVAEAEGWSPATYDVFSYFQSGGKADYKLEAGMKSFGMSVCDPVNEGYTYTITSFDGKNVPMFGYESSTQKLWTQAFFYETNTSKYAKVVAVMNVVDAPESPMVINGCWTHAYVQNVKADAELTLTICPLTKEGYILPAIVTSTIKGSEIGKDGAMGDYKSLSFKFDKPLVMSTDVCSQYIVRLTGFDGAADYFAPLQSYYGAYNGVNHGFVEFEVYDGATKTPATQDLEYFTNYSQAFGFNFDAVYPWLEGATEAVATADTPAVVALDSYYDGSELTITSSDERFTAKAEGKYGQCTLTISTTAAADCSGTITLTAPGVSHTVAVSTSTSGVAAISAEASEVTAVYDIQGRRMQPDCLPAGIYVRRHADGSASKFIVR